MTTTRWQVIQCDCREGLRALGDESFNMAVTSPPYLGLRDYGTDSWEGGDPACQHVSEPGAATGNKGAVTTVPYRGACPSCGAVRVARQVGLERTIDEYVGELVSIFREARRVLRGDGTLWLVMGDSYEGKSLIGLPWRVAFALQADGWYLRSDIVWAKPNPMPSSVTDRCTASHEYVFMLSKSERYYFDWESIAEPYGSLTSGDSVPLYGAGYGRARKRKDRVGGATGSRVRHSEGHVANGEMRNRRDVWAVPLRGYDHQLCRQCKRIFDGYTFAKLAPVVDDKGDVVSRACVCGADDWLSHYATFPTALVRPMILAGSPLGGSVLDPFCGTGTTLAVAAELQRDALGLELNADYCLLAEHRLAETTPGFKLGVA